MPRRRARLRSCRKSEPLRGSHCHRTDTACPDQVSQERAPAPSGVPGPSVYALDLAREGVAGLEAAGIEAGLEPVIALLRGAVGEGLRVDPPLRLLLDPIVADSRRRGQAFLEVTVLEDAPVIGRPRPDAGQAVGLELESHRERVGVVGIRLALLSDVLLDAELLLDVVAQLVGDDIGLGEVAGSLEALVQLVEEAEIEIDLAIERAVERPGRGAGEAAARLGLTLEDHDLRPLIPLSRRLELLRPEALGVPLDEVDELHLPVLIRTAGDGVAARPRRGDLRKGVGRLRNIESAATAALDEEEVDDREHDQRADAAAAEAAHRDRHAASAEPSPGAATILDVAAALPRLPLHASSLAAE